ncbi:MAG: hypothetical protein ABIG39_02975 [Candidatus Micrarchaeota archaeon]
MSKTIRINMGFGLSARHRDDKEGRRGDYFSDTCLRPRRLILDKHLEGLSVRKLTPDRALDVTGTNKIRVAYALDKRLSPVFKRDGGTVFRVVQKDKEGVLNFGFSSSMPRDMIALSDSETVPLPVAAQYLGIGEHEIKSAFSTQGLRRNGDRVNLNDLNFLKE